MTTLGPLGNKQVRVEDFITIQNASAGAAGTVAVNTVTVNASAGGVPAGAYFLLSGPEPLAQETQNPVQKYHVWYSKDGAVDPLPQDSNRARPSISNNIGIKVITTNQSAAELAFDTTATINNYFLTRPNSVSVSATGAGSIITITNLAVGPALVEDGIGSRGGVPASTGFVFASTTPGVLPDIISFTLASTLEASGATGASILTLIPFVTTSAISTVSSFGVSDDPESLCILCPDGTAFDAGGVATHFRLTTDNEERYVWYNSGSVATVHRIAGITGDTDGSLGGLGFVLDAASGIFNFWFDVSAIPEVTSIRTVADVGGNLGGTFFKINDTADEHYVWFNVSAIVEVSEVRVPTGAGLIVASSVAATHFQLFSPSADFYVWYSAGSAIDPGASGTGIQVSASTVDVSAVIASNTASAINAITNFSAVASDAAVTITNASVGNASDIVSVTASGFSFSTLTQGLASSIDPAPSVSGVGIQIDITRDDTATTIAAQTGSVIGGAAEADFGSPTVSGIDVLVTVGSVGNTPDASDNNTGFTIATLTQGVASSVDPSQGGTSRAVSIDPNASADTVTAQLASVMGATSESEAFITSVSGLSISAINHREGTSETGLGNTTGFSLSVLLAGRNPNSDPAASGTGLEVAASRLSTSDEVCLTTASVINADGTFNASATGAKVTVTTSEAGVPIFASGVTASVGFAGVTAGFTVLFSNRQSNPDFDSETS